METQIKNIVFIAFVLSVIFFIYYLSLNMIDNSNNETINNYQSNPGHSTIIDSINNTELTNTEKSNKFEKSIDNYFKEAAPLQKYSGVKDEPNNFDSKNRLLVTDYPKDTMAAYSPGTADNNSTYLTLPNGSENNFNDAYGLPVEGTSKTQSNELTNDFDMIYNNWFQGRKPIELIPDKSITYPKFEKKLDNVQDYTSLGEWTYKNETNMNTGKTGNNITGYSSFHDTNDLFDNKLEISKCH